MAKPLLPQTRWLGRRSPIDGYIAGPNESGSEHLFGRFFGGAIEYLSLDPNVTFRLNEPE
jgi:hypothetical protein